MTRADKRVWNIVSKAMKGLGCAGLNQLPFDFPLSFYRKYGVRFRTEAEFDAGMKRLVLVSRLPIRILPNRRLRACRRLMQCNLAIYVGQFLLTPANEIIFRTILPVDRPGPSVALVRRTLKEHRLTVAEHLPRLAAALHENITLGQALDNVWRSISGGTGCAASPKEHRP